MDLPTDDLKALITELRETNRQWRELIAARTENELLRAEAAATDRARSQEGHDSYLKSQEAYRERMSASRSPPGRLVFVGILVMLWSAVVSTLLLNWIIHK